MPMHNSGGTVQMHPKCHLQEEHVDQSDSASSLPVTLRWLILCVNLARLGGTQIASRTFFLGMSVRAALEEISIWISRLTEKFTLNNGVGIIQSTECLKRTERGKNGEFLFCFSWDIHLLPSHIPSPGSWAFWLRTYIISSLISGLWTWTDLHHGLPGFPARKWTSWPS